MNFGDDIKQQLFSYLIFLKKTGYKEIKNKRLQKSIHNSKSGYLKIKKISNNTGFLNYNEEFEGYTIMFGKNVVVYLINSNNYYHTSIIKEIDWKKKIFKTLNSDYSFEFEEIEDLNKILENYKNEVENLYTK